MIEAIGFGVRVGRFHLRDVHFAVPRGGYGVVIGPAGAGKTTLLEAVAGISGRTEGVLRLDGASAERLPPEHRGVGLVYQHAHLFTHLSVADNIRYGTSDSGAASDVSRRLGADVLEGRPVESLSGGERQLVALARALAPRPRYLLLDEPFSALDPRRRAAVRREVRAIAREAGMTVLQVTHDFAEAGYLGDVLILLDGGRVLQAGTPEAVFRRPVTPYVAEFLGAENIFAGTARDSAPRDAGHPSDDRSASPEVGRSMVFETSGLAIDVVGDVPPGPCHAVLRAEEVLLSLESLASSARNRFEAVVQDVTVTGPLARITLVVGGTLLVAALTRRSAEEMGLRPGMRAFVSFKAMAVHLC